MKLKTYHIVIKSNFNNYLQFQKTLLPELVFLKKKLNRIIIQDVNYIKHINNPNYLSNLICSLNIIADKNVILKLYKHLKGSNSVNNIFIRKIKI